MTSQPFSDDTPKTNPWQDDRLGYRPFAERLAKAIVGLDAPNGYVIGLHGPWGSGKSTALNFVQAFLKKYHEERSIDDRSLQIIEFRPWIISGHQDLVSGFFKVLSEAMKDKVESRRKLRRRILGMVRTGADPVIGATATLGLALNPTVGMVTKAGAAIAGKATNAAVDRWLKEPSLQTAYDNLRDRLADQNSRFLVLIDDIDRLDKSEIRVVMQMVKSVGRLPNVIYLLAYDRTIVWNALDADMPQEKGQPSYGEKIVQQEIELPSPQGHSLLTIFHQEVDFIIGSTSSNLRWQYIVRAGIYRWIRYPRDVFRLANALKFAWPALEGEMDPQDLLAMEGMRLFDTDIFEWVRQNRNFLLSEGHYRIETEDQLSVVGEALRSSLSAGTLQDKLQLLCALFPQRTAALRGEKRWDSSEPYYEIVKRRGIASKAGYDAYFSLHPSPNAVPKTMIDTAITQIDNYSAQLLQLQNILSRTDQQGAPLIGDYLQELNYRLIGVGAVRPTIALLSALFEVSEEIIAVDLKQEGFLASPRMQQISLVHEMLEKWGPVESATALEEMFTRHNAPTLSAEIWTDQARSLGELPTTGRVDQPLISKVDLLRLGERLLAMIENLARCGELAKAPLYYHITRAWAYLGGAEPVQAWLRSGVHNSPHFLITVSRGFLGYTVGQLSREYTYQADAEHDLLDEATLLSAARDHRQAANLSPDDHARIEALIEGLKKRMRQTIYPNTEDQE